MSMALIYDIRLDYTKVTGSERARERMSQGATVPGSELASVLLADSLPGANCPGSEKALNLTVLPPDFLYFVGLHFVMP